MKFYYEGEPEAEGEGEGEPTPTPTPTTTPKTFTQEQVNTFLAEEKRRAQKANERTIKQLQDIQKTAQLTQEEKEKLESRIEDLRNEYLTKEEIAKKEQKKESEKAKREYESIAKDRDLWKNRYIDSTIERDLFDASASEAHNPIQVVELLKNKTRLIDELDSENQPTGRLIPKVRIAGKDKDGKDVILDLSPTEAIKQMKDMPEHGNLFKSGAHGGVNGSNNPLIRQKTGPPLGNQAEYLAWRKAQLNRK